MKIAKSFLLTFLFALASEAATGSPGVCTQVSCNQTPAPGPYVISWQPAASPPALGNVVHYSLAGHVDAKSDPAGYFAAVSVNDAVSGTMDVSPALLAAIANAKADATVYEACPGNPADSICDCGCYYGAGFFNTPGTELCPATSPAKTTNPQSNCDPNAIPELVDYSAILAPGSGQGFSLSFDGVSLAQDPAQPWFAYDAMQPVQTPTPAFQNLLHFGGAVKGLYPFNPPDGGLLCTGGAPCGGAYDVQLEYAFNMLDEPIVSGARIEYYSGSAAGAPSGSLHLAIDHQWTPGAADPGGPMIWQNAWQPATFYAVNSVVTWLGTTYIATNATIGTPPDRDHAEWLPIGTAMVTESLTVSVGPQGPQGPAGPQGPQGDPGPQGPPGPDFTAQVTALSNQVTTLATRTTALESSTARLRNDLQIVSSAAFAALEASDTVREHFVAAVESLGQDPIAQLESVSQDLGLPDDPDALLQLGRDVARYTMAVMSLQSQIRMVEAKLASCAAPSSCDGLQAKLVALHAKLALVQGGDAY